MAVPVKLEHRDSMLRAFEGSKEKSGFSAVARAEEHASHMKLLENALKVGAPLSHALHAHARAQAHELSPRLPSRATGCEESARGAVSSIGGHPAAGVCAYTEWHTLRLLAHQRCCVPPRPSSLSSHASRHAHVCRRQRARCGVSR